MNNKTDIDVRYVSPLKKICMTIGELPASYLETMTYYEMLVWFTEFLRNTVIPTVNNNAEAVSELQALYEELRTYVNDYFDNLDVQDEINNKLEAMAESGQLTDIIAQYLGLAGMIAFDNVADMKLAENLVNGSKCCTLGFTNVNDNGNAIYKVRTVTNDDVIDEKTIIALYDNNLVAELVTKAYVTPEMFGAYGDGTHDDTEALNKTFEFQNIIMRKNAVYKVKYIDLKVPNTFIDGNNATISIDTDIELGQASNGFGNFVYRNDYSYNRFTMKNLNFNGNTDTFEDYQNYTANQLNFLLVSLNKYKFVKVENCKFENCIQDALWVIDTNHIEIIGNKFKDVAIENPKMVGTLNAITAMSDRTDNSVLIIKNNEFDNIGDSACRIDDFGVAEFSNNVGKNISFTTCETFYNSRSYECSLNIFNNNITNTGFFVTAGHETNKELINLDLNIYNNNVIGLGYNERGTTNSYGKFVTVSHATGNNNTYVNNNIINVSHTDGTLFYASGNKINVSNNIINIAALVTGSSMGNAICNGRDITFKDNELKYNVVNQYNMFYMSKPADETKEINAKITGNKFILRNCTRIIEGSKDVNNVVFDKNYISLEGTSTGITTIYQGTDNTKVLSHCKILENTVPASYAITNFVTSDISDLIIKNNVFKSDINLNYLIQNIDSSKKIVDDNILVL